VNTRHFLLRAAFHQKPYHKPISKDEVRRAVLPWGVRTADIALIMFLYFPPTPKTSNDGGDKERWDALGNMAPLRKNSP
jgi:hypothetical protein